MKDQIINLIVRAFEEIQEDYPNVNLEDPPEKTPLFGKRSTLDSLGLVNLIVCVEEAILNELDKEIVIADDRAMSKTVSPFLSIGSLARHIEKVLSNDKS